MVSGHPFCERHGEFPPHPAKFGSGACENSRLKTTTCSRSSDRRRSIRDCSFDFLGIRRRFENENVTQFDVLPRSLSFCVLNYQRTGLFEVPGILTGNQPGYRAEADTTEASRRESNPRSPNTYPGSELVAARCSRGILPGG